MENDTTSTEWLKDARYTKFASPDYRITVSIPNSATEKKVYVHGQAASDLVQCLLDALGVPGQSLAGTAEEQPAGHNDPQPGKPSEEPASDGVENSQASAN